MKMWKKKHRKVNLQMISEKEGAIWNAKNQNQVWFLMVATMKVKMHCIRIVNYLSHMKNGSIFIQNWLNLIMDKTLSFKYVFVDRSLSNNDLNIAIMQCSGSLELLTDKRKNLELLVQMQHNVANINYNFSYSPRLPDSPTRVDRLMYDISRERCRVSLL